MTRTALLEMGLEVIEADLAAESEKVRHDPGHHAEIVVSLAQRAPAARTRRLVSA